VGLELILAIVAVAWLGLAVVTVALCTMAARGDRALVDGGTARHRGTRRFTRQASRATALR